MEELIDAGVPEELANSDTYVAAKGTIDNPTAFDARFFGISPNEAELIDPQQRLFLETCWHAMESAGYIPGDIKGSVGVWGGASTGMRNSTYQLNNVYNNGGPAPEEQVNAMLGNASGYLSTRVSYKLNFTGPSVTVQSACSTSLVAHVRACS